MSTSDSRSISCYDCGLEVSVPTHEPRTFGLGEDVASKLTAMNWKLMRPVGRGRRWLITCPECAKESAHAG